jgi:localization factor PodJL
VQIALTYEGYPVGRVDGVVGRLTSGAIIRYQTAHGLTVTGEVDDALIARLGLHHCP